MTSAGHTNCPLLKNGEQFCAKGQYAGSLFTSYAPSGAFSVGFMQANGIGTNQNVARSLVNQQGLDIQRTASFNAAAGLASMRSPDFDSFACSRDQDCAGTKVCNLNRPDWGESFGAFSPYCTEPQYPELATGVFMRETAMNGGIGAQCFSDSDCATGKGYRCTPGDVGLGNVTQGGYCAQTFKCGAETKYLKYPYGSSVPVQPSPSDNNSGAGFSSFQECNDSAAIGAATRHCKQAANGRWYSVFPGYCPAAPVAETRAWEGQRRGEVQAANSTVDFGASRGAGFDPLRYEASINIPRRR